MSEDNKRKKHTKLEIIQGSITTILAIITLGLTWKTFELDSRVKKGDIEIKRIGQELQREKDGFDQTRDVYDRVERYLSTDQDEKKGIALVALINTIPLAETKNKLLSAISKQAEIEAVVLEAADSLTKTTIVQRSLDGAKFVGDLSLEFEGNTGFAKLKNDFGFIDSEGVVWTAPAGSLTDGASIPALYAPIYGSSFDELLIKAAAIHDHYVNTKERSSESTHQMFYEALLASGVGSLKAKVMYASIDNFGPRWDVP